MSIYTLAMTRAPSGSFSTTEERFPQGGYIVGGSLALAQLSGLEQPTVALTLARRGSQNELTTISGQGMIAHLAYSQLFMSAVGRLQSWAQTGFTIPEPGIRVEAGQSIFLQLSGSVTTAYALVYVRVAEPRGSTVARIARSSVDRFIAAPERAITGSENLKARVVRADKAAACCRKGQLIILRQVTEVLSDCFAVIQGLKSNETIVLAGGVIGTAPALVRTSTGLVEFEQLLARPVNLLGPADPDFTRLLNQVKTVRPAPRPIVSPGQIAVLAGVTAAGLLIDVAAQTAALEAVSLVGGAINGGVQYRPDQCTECVLAACLPQNAPRQRQKTKILRRVGGAEP